MTPDDFERDPTQWFPMPAALVTSRPSGGRPNLMGIGYVGFTCWQPRVVCLGTNTARYTGVVIQETRQFVVALPRPVDVMRVDYCGFISGTSLDKFQATGLTTRDARHVQAPLINECLVNLECELIQVVPLGSHALYLGRVVCTHVDETLRSGDVELDPIILVSRRYKAANQFLCDFGASAGCPPE